MSANCQPVHITLFKERKEPIDAYEAAFASPQFRCEFSPPLQFEHCSAELVPMLLRGPSEVSGLICTSQRSIQSLQVALTSSELSAALVASWRTVPMFVVGAASASCAAAAGFAVEPCFENVCSATSLGQLLVQRRQEFSRPFLFLCGNQRLDDLPRILSEAEISFSELCVYRTLKKEMPIPLTSSTTASSQRWFGFFSPSGVAAAVEQCADLSGVRIAAIGPTTAAAVLQCIGRPADAVAAQPSAAALREAIDSVLRT